jgi:SAM-dependent methyltransferase
VFEALEEEPATADDLARRLGIHPQGARRLLMALEELGLVDRDHGHFRNSSLGSYCTPRSPLSLEPLAMWGVGTPFYHMWEFLPDAVRERKPLWQQALGAKTQGMFTATFEDPSRLPRFAQWVTAYGTPQGRLIAELIDFAPYHRVLDVGGGSGAISIQIGLRHPHLRGIVLDLAPMCAVARDQIQLHELAVRFTTVTADLFAGPYPAGADVILLGSILHDWDDPKCETILRNCRDALPPGGLLLVVDKVLHDDFSGPRVGLMLDLHMLVVSEGGGRERSEAEYRSLLEGAGFCQVEVTWLDAPRDLIVARKA